MKYCRKISNYQRKYNSVLVVFLMAFTYFFENFYFSDSLTSTLSVQIDSGSDFAATNFTFYDCSTYKSCGDCTMSKFQCDWCAENAVCTHNSSRCTSVVGNEMFDKATSRKSGAKSCPKILPMHNNESQFFIASGADRVISVRYANLLVSFNYNI